VAEERNDCTLPMIEISQLKLVSKMAAMWNPESNGLQQILQLLRESQSPDNMTQRTVQQVSFIITWMLYGIVTGLDYRRG